MLATTRFNNETLESNYKYREKNEIVCMYCCPLELSPKIMYDSFVFVIEMNNSKNEIEGIGLIQNTIMNKKYCKVHKDANNNRYIYIGKYHIKKTNLIVYNPRLIESLEIVLFKGRTHSKRGSGITLFPTKMLNHELFLEINLKREIKNIFVQHYGEIKFA
jgi:hypothetical protein